MRGLPSVSPYRILVLGLNGLAEVFRIVRIDEGHVDADAREGVVELIERAAIQRGSRHDVIARAAQRQDRHGLRRMPRARGQRAHAALQIGQALLKHIGGGIHDARVDVAEFLQRKQIGRVLRAAEHDTRWFDTSARRVNSSWDPAAAPHAAAAW